MDTCADRRNVCLERYRQAPPCGKPIALTVAVAALSLLTGLQLVVPCEEPPLAQKVSTLRRPLRLCSGWRAVRRRGNLGSCLPKAGMIDLEASLPGQALGRRVERYCSIVLCFPRASVQARACPILFRRAGEKGHTLTIIALLYCFVLLKLALASGFILCYPPAHATDDLRNVRVWRNW